MPATILATTAIPNGNKDPWTDTVNDAVLDELKLEDATDYLQPDLFDVAIIGGGISGLSAAASAASAGAKVVLLERANRLGSGASGRNAGIICVGVNMPLTNLVPDAAGTWLWQETAHLAEWLFSQCRQPGCLLLGRKTGSLFLATTKTAARRLASEVRARNQANLRAELISASAVKRLSSGWINASSIIAAQYLPDEGRANPLTLLAFLAQNARAAKAQLLGNCAVDQAQEHGATSSTPRHWLLHLSNGLTVAAKSLIRCTGPILEANSRIYALSFKVPLPEDFPVFQDAAPYTYYDYRAGDGLFTVSGGRYGCAGATSSDARYHRKMADAARAWMPDIIGEPEYRWAVDLKVASDMIPNLKQIGNSVPAVAIEGLGALGVVPGIALGRKAGSEMLAEDIVINRLRR